MGLKSGTTMRSAIKHHFYFVMLVISIQESASKQGYILTSPNRLVPGKAENVCIQFKEDTSSVAVQYSLRHHDFNSTGIVYIEKKTNFTSRAGGCTSLLLPNDFRQFSIELAVSGQSADGYSFEGKRLLSVLSKNNQFTLIQTDKPIYKPGQIVKFRLITLTSDLKPVYDQDYKIWIENPAGIYVDQWLSVPSISGIAELSFKLVDEPTLGKWKIGCITSDKRKEEAFFKVEEYVLPKFEVTIQSLSSASLRSKFVTGEICARYTYGQPVKGNLKATFKLESTYWWQERYNPLKLPYLYLQEINGCHRFNLSSEVLGLSALGDNNYGLQFEIKATVTEAGTGIEAAAEARVLLDSADAVLEIVGSDKFKPGLDYTAEVKVSKKDGSPLSGKVVEVSISSQRGKQNVTKHTTDKNGRISLSMPTGGSKSLEHVIQATLRDPGTAKMPEWMLPKAYKSLKPWYSPSGSYLQLQAPSAGIKLTCGQVAQVHLLYTTDVKKTAELIVQVVGRDDIELNTRQEVVLDTEKLIHWTIDPVKIMPTPSTNITQNASASTDEPDDQPLPQPEDVQVLTEEPPGTPSDMVLAIARRSTYITDPGNYHTHGRSKPVDNIMVPFKGKTSVTFSVTSQMSPYARLLVFYIRLDGEIVADDITLEVESCTDNPVQMTFSKETARPGEVLALQLKAHTGSLCAFGVVDKSVHLMGGDNLLNLLELFKELQSFQLSESSGVDSYYGENSYCEQKIKAAEQKMNSTTSIDEVASSLYYRRWRTYYSLYHDSSHAFQKSATAVLTDLTLDSRPCIQEEVRPRYMKAKNGNLGMPMPMAEPMVLYSRSEVLERQVDSSIQYTPSVEIRTYFPETWLWETVWLNNSGSLSMKQVMPHTITEWRGSAVCLHGDHGFGVSNTASVTAFQPFFLSVDLPYSVVQGETVPVAISVFNYLSECLSVELILKGSVSSEFDIKGNRNVLICVCGRESQVHHYQIVPKRIGNVNITVTAKSIKGRGACNANATMSSIVGIRDAIVRSLLIEPEGAPREYTMSSFVCLKKGQAGAQENFSLAVPVDTVPNSARSFVSIVGDVMGPSLSNLDNLLRMPWGCGEQNMVGFAPNIFVMQYLEATKQVNDDISKKAIEYMKSGYQRELTYIHDDSSYSAFGKSDQQGSIWLTAFVVKCFAQARTYIHIDDVNLNNSIVFFKRNQLENGCFPEIGTVHSKYMRGGLQESEENNQTSMATLTAYIVIALLEANVSRQDTVIANAIGCLDTHTVEDSYSLALLGYAYSLYDVKYPRRIEIMSQLDKKALKNGGAHHWEREAETKPTVSPAATWWWRPLPASADVEMTAYALLAFLQDESTAISAGLPIVRWLSQQRNAYGGFASTQDTVLAIQGLAKFASLTYVSDVDMKTVVTANGFQQAFKTNKDNSLVVRTAQLPQLPIEPLTFTISGQGCVLVQANVRYNVKSYGAPGPAFDTKVKIYSTGNCKRHTLDICTKYQGKDDASNMAIVDVKMVSGYVPDKETLKVLQNSSTQLKRHEVSDKIVSLYFDQISKVSKCFQFGVVQEHEVADTKPGSITTYDYYDTELRHETSYQLLSLCKEKREEIIIASKTMILGGGVQEQLPQQILLSNDGVPEDARRVCPRCLQEVSSAIVCKSARVLKVAKARPSTKLRVMADLRKEKKVVYQHVHVNYTMSSLCECKILQDTSVGTKLIVSQEISGVHSALEENTTSVLDLMIGNTSVFLVTPEAEIEVYRAVKSCG